MLRRQPVASTTEPYRRVTVTRRSLTGGGASTSPVASFVYATYDDGMATDSKNMINSEIHNAGRK